MSSLEDRARQLGIGRLHLDTATNQPEAVAFYHALGYQEVGTEHQAGWSWTLVYFAKHLTPSSPTTTRVDDPATILTGLRQGRPHRGDGDGTGSTPLL
jgi:hypothetical protein